MVPPMPMSTVAMAPAGSRPGMTALATKPTRVPKPSPGGCLWNWSTCKMGIFPLHVGDRVRIAPITRAEFQRLRGKRL
jgi:hypothetical protein